jgi:hypothetical protein
MDVKRLPYEVLFRFDESGALIGSHVQWRYVVSDDSGAKVAETIEHAKPVAVGKVQGFPLADILNDVQTAAVLQAEAKTAELETVQASLDDAKAELGRMTAEVATATSTAEPVKQA